MKKTPAILALAFGLTFLVVGQSQARYPPPPTSQCCWAAIGAKLKGQVIVRGRVAGMKLPGRGLIIKTPRGQRTIYGLGPRWYWQRKGMARPWLGEKIRVKALRIWTPRGSYLVACEIKTPRGRIRLRDPRTGLPLWGRWYKAKDGRTWWRRTCMKW